METLIIVVIVVGVVWSLIVGKPEGARFREKYDGWDVYVSSFGDGVIALNRSMGRIVVGTLDVHIERDLSTLASVSAEKDGQGLTTTNRGSQAVGAAVGGLLLGPLGLMIGGVTGSRSHTERVNELALKIVM